MSMTTKIILSCLGLIFGGLTSYYQDHGGPGVNVTSLTFWIGAVMAGLVPLGSYFVGLAQKAPWEALQQNPTAGDKGER